MKETKVYIDELPKSCFECPIIVDGSEGCDFCVCAILEEKAETKNRLKDCPLHSIKDHDRELVNKVCEKIREYLRTQVIYCGGKATELDIMIASAVNQVLEDVKQFLDQIQKLEGEDE